MLKQNKKDKQDRHRWLLIGFLCLFGVCLVAQVRPTEQKTKATGTSTKSVADTSKTTKKQPENKKTKVYLLHADEGQADKLARPDVQVLIGNVKMRHDSMYMYCDSVQATIKAEKPSLASNFMLTLDASHKVFDRLFEEAEIAKFTPQEMREYEASKSRTRRPSSRTM